MVTAEWNLLVGVGHSRDLLQDLETLMTRRALVWSDVDLLVTSLGPGSFTGVRIAMASMKGLAMSLGRELRGVGLLDALAAPLQSRGCAVLAAMDARKGQLYAALYGPAGDVIVPACAAGPQELAAAVVAAWPEGPILGVGEGVLAYASELASCLSGRLVVAEAEWHRVRAAVIARLGAGMSDGQPSLSDLEPLYLRRSEAEIRAETGTASMGAGTGT